jgi:hypothetical protein
MFFGKSRKYFQNIFLCQELEFSKKVSNISNNEESNPNRAYSGVPQEFYAAAGKTLAHEKRTRRSFNYRFVLRFRYFRFLKY